MRGFPEKGRSLWGSSIYDVRKNFRFLDPLPPQNSRNLVPFVCFVGTRSPSHCGRQIWKPLALIALPSVPEISLSSSQTGIELDLDFFSKVKRLLNFMLVNCLRPLRQGKVAQSTQTLSPNLSTAPPSLDRTLRIWIALNGRKPIPACTLTEAGSICSPSPRGEGVKAKENFYCRCKRLLFPLPLCLPQLMKFSLPHAPQCFRLSASLFTRVQVDKVAE